MKSTGGAAMAGLLAAGSMAMAQTNETVGAKPKTFGEDVAFLGAHTEVITLEQGDAKVAVVPAYQGRVMTSTTGGDAGPSFGWLNYKVIKAGLLSPAARKGKLEDHIYVFGGEERFWLGPEGGQYALYFAPGSAFEFAHWHTPAVIDSEPFELAGRTSDSAVFRRSFSLVNYSGTRFDAAVQRTIRLLSPGAARTAFGAQWPDSVKAVAYESDNLLTNRGREPWTKEKGQLSIWLLGMYNPSPTTTVVIPFKAGPEETLGPKVNDAYFGKVPADYLVVKDNVLFFRADGTRRGKIGISPKRSLGLAGSYDAAGGVLTLVTYNVPDAHGGYVNSMWEIQKDPYGGDALNSYNDGSPEPGAAPLGPFYELETSSPAAALKPGESIRHLQRTVHLAGSEADLEAVAKSKFGVGLAEIRDAFKGAAASAP